MTRTRARWLAELLNENEGRDFGDPQTVIV
jgi:hypothetical protein